MDGGDGEKDHVDAPPYLGLNYYRSDAAADDAADDVGAAGAADDAAEDTDAADVDAEEHRARQNSEDR